MKTVPHSSFATRRSNGKEWKFRGTCYEETADDSWLDKCIINIQAALTLSTCLFLLHPLFARSVPFYLAIALSLSLSLNLNLCLSLTRPLVPYHSPSRSLFFRGTPCIFSMALLEESTCTRSMNSLYFPFYTGGRFKSHFSWRRLIWYIFIGLSKTRMLIEFLYKHFNIW
jgi:hypothetical protein